MKSYVILFVALTMLVKPLWPVAEYVINYDYIVNILCANKDKPELQCDGKCYLTQLLAEESNQNKENPFSEQQTKAEIQHPVFFESLLEVSLGLDFLTSKNRYCTASRNLIVTLFTTDISQPPEFG